MRGISGSGKSTVAKKLASKLDATLIEYDDIKSELVDVLQCDNLAPISYKIARNLIKSNLAFGNNVIFDSLGYFEENYRKCKRLLPKEYKMVIIECKCENKEVLRRRLLNRKNIKRAQGNDYESAINSIAKMETIKHPHFFVLDTTKSINLAVDLVINYLESI